MAVSSQVNLKLWLYYNHHTLTFYITFVPKTTEIQIPCHVKGWSFRLGGILPKCSQNITDPWMSLVVQGVKDPRLSLLWCEFNPGPGSSTCCRCDQKKKKKKKKKKKTLTDPWLTSANGSISTNSLAITLQLESFLLTWFQLGLWRMTSSLGL